MSKILKIIFADPRITPDTCPLNPDLTSEEIEERFQQYKAHMMQDFPFLFEGARYEVLQEDEGVDKANSI